MNPRTLRNIKMYTMKVKWKTERQKLITQASRNPDKSIAHNSDPEIIVSNVVVDTAVGETASTFAAFKKLVHWRICKLREILTSNSFDYAIVNHVSEGIWFSSWFEGTGESEFACVYNQVFSLLKRYSAWIFLRLKNNIKTELIKYWLTASSKVKQQQPSCNVSMLSLLTNWWQEALTYQKLHQQ